MFEEGYCSQSFFLVVLIVVFRWLGSLKDMVEVLIFGMYLLYGYDQFTRRCFYVTLIISFEYQVVVFSS